MRKKRLSTVWLAGTPKELHDKLTGQVNVVLEDKVIDRLRQILQEKIETKETIFDYSIPNWPYRQAHNNGYVEAMNEVLTILQKASDPNE